MKQKINFHQISLPSFHGFYDSIWSEMDTDEIEYYAQEHNITHVGDWGYKDYAEHQDYICREYARLAIEEMNFDLGLNIKHGAVRMWSPREYNFCTDRIDVVIELSEEDRERIIHLMLSDYNRMQEEIHKHHTSRDGFISFMSNDIDEWLALFQAGDGEKFGLYLGYALYYLWGDRADEFEYYAYEVIAGNYCAEVEPYTDEARLEWEKIQIVEDYFGIGSYDPEKMGPWSIEGTKFRCEKAKWEREHMLKLAF